LGPADRRRRVVSRSAAPGMIVAAARASPRASAATSAVAEFARYQPCRRYASHSLASVVLPYPAGAGTRMVREFASSSARVNRAPLMTGLRRAGPPPPASTFIGDLC